MYSSNYFESDLVNSYMWDTAIVFIQNYSGNRNYAKKKSVNSSLKSTGKAGDKVCNIHDMASNCWEWSTEHNADTSYFCIGRGGCYAEESYYSTTRVTSILSVSVDYVSFRIGLYIK
ncbi:MAG: hypothetical protein HFJ28_06540 [Clostridia bacterium]|jgi:formylglycine-generating enzyme required for sulfatase activity|nr:hypothetical protein [Clostridia bacterium]